MRTASICLWRGMFFASCFLGIMVPLAAMFPLDLKDHVGTRTQQLHFAIRTQLSRTYQMCKGTDVVANVASFTDEPRTQIQASCYSHCAQSGM